ncbi:hypothetical protein BDV06DRAFT_6766 [Aspergillus oleicola]
MSIYNGYLLPNEILQAIILLLDFESFYHASRVCRLWRDAALSLHILRQQLQSVPCLRDSSRLQSASEHKLRDLYAQTCRTNLIGLRNNITFTTVTSESTAAQISSIPVRSHHGPLFVRLQGMTLSLRTSSAIPTAKSDTRSITLSPKIYPSPETVQQLLSQGQTSAFFSSRSFATLQVAVSECGGLIAVALGQKVHVYLLQSGWGTEREQQHAEVTISSNVTDSVRSIEFEENNQLLRVEVGGQEGNYVRYLGFRKCRCSNNTRSSGTGLVSVSGEMKLKYWNVALRRVHLDSRSVEEGLGGGVSTRGMRLIPLRRPQQPKTKNGSENAPCTCRSETHFLTLLRRVGCKNIYAVGSISNSNNNGMIAKIIQEMPSRAVTPQDLKSYFQLQPVLREVKSPSPSPDGAGYSQQLDRFDDATLPQAHCHDPVLSVSDDGQILAIYEQPHGQARGAIYLCLRDDEDDSVKGARDASVVAWPFVLSTLDQGVDSLRVSVDQDTRGYTVEARSQRQSIQWRLCRS